MRFLRSFFITFAFLFALSGVAAAANTDAVDINTADAQTLAAALKGVGPDKAEAIVAYRDTHGPFKSIDDLTQVKGIGEKTVDRNRDAITVGDTTAVADQKE
jgi:competence protein ComEA